MSYLEYENLWYLKQSILVSLWGEKKKGAV